MDRMNKLTVGELAERTQTTRRALRLYEQIGLIHPERDVNGYRLYSEQDVDEVTFIKALRSIGASLKELVELFQIKRSTLPEPEKYRQFMAMIDQGADQLLRQREAIDSALAQMDEYRQEMLAKIAARATREDA